jgi:hypothetical protein
VDTDGSVYLIWKSDQNNPACGSAPRIWSQKLSTVGVSVVGSPTQLLARDQVWEGAVIEAPSMVLDGGSYYLFYSANNYDTSYYSVGYAVCQSPVGPCVKKTVDQAGGASPALIHSAGPAQGPGGQEFFRDMGGKLWVAYHAWTSPLVGYPSGGQRSLRIDSMSFSGGYPVTLAPTTTSQPL